MFEHNKIMRLFIFLHASVALQCYLGKRQWTLREANYVNIIHVLDL